MDRVATKAGTASGLTQEGSGGDGLGETEALKGALVVDTDKVRGHLDEVVRSTVEETLNALLDAEGYREILGVTEGTKEDAESWRMFLRHLKDRGLSGVKLFITDKCLGLVKALAEFNPEASLLDCPSVASTFRANGRYSTRISALAAQSSPRTSSSTKRPTCQCAHATDHAESQCIC